MIDRTLRRQKLERDRRGYITTGRKSEKGRPQTLDHFNVERFPEIIQYYGERPTELVIMLPDDDIETFFTDDFAAWGQEYGSAVKKRFCNGKQCTHRIDETVEGVTYGRGEVSACICEDLPADSKARCRYTAILKASLVSPDGQRIISPHVYGFKTGSQNSGDQIFGELERLDLLLRIHGDGRPQLKGKLCTLSVKMVQGKESVMTKFPIWTLEAFRFVQPTLPESEDRRMLEGRTVETAEIEHDEEDAPEEHADLTPVAQKVKRPFPPSVLRARMIAGSETIDGAIAGGRPPLHPRGELVKRTATAMNNLTRTPQDRRRLMQYLFGKDSTSDLSDGQCEVLLMWVDVRKEATKQGDVWVPNAHATKEAWAVLNREEVTP